jgi:hypothetical protein
MCACVVADANHLQCHIHSTRQHKPLLTTKTEHHSTQICTLGVSCLWFKSRASKATVLLSRKVKSSCPSQTRYFIHVCVCVCVCVKQHGPLDAALPLQTQLSLRHHHQRSPLLLCVFMCVFMCFYVSGMCVFAVSQCEWMDKAHGGAGSAAPFFLLACSCADRGAAPLHSILILF